MIKEKCLLSKETILLTFTISTVWYYFYFIDNNLEAAVFVCKNNDDPVKYQTLESN